MEDAELYKDYNSQQRRHALELLNEHGHRYNWKNQRNRVLDIGCGDGGVTVDVLRKFLPSNYEKLVGMDISENMVNLANKQHSDERTSFVVQDIAGVLQPGLRQSFDHAFSIYAINWVKNQKSTFTNIYDILAPGGDFLFLILTKSPVFEVYRRLQSTEKWRSILGDIEQYVSPYHDSKDPEKELRNLLESLGFRNIFLKLENKRFYYENIDVLLKSMMAISPFQIPRDMQDEYPKDYLQALRDLGYLNKTQYGPDDVAEFKGGLYALTAYACK